jgi:Transcriptional regulators
MTNRQALASIISQQLGTRIVAGGLSAGDSFRLHDIQEEFGVSVTVAREVMLNLASKGLVEARPRRGISVREREFWDLLDADVLTWHTSHLGPIISDLEAARQLIEPWAARIAAREYDPSTAAMMRKAMSQLESAARDGSRKAVTEADLEFHRRLLEASGNAVISRIARVIEPALRRRDELTMHDEHITDLGFLPLHEAIVVAIERGNETAAEHAANRLIESSSIDSTEALRSDQSA